MLCSLKSSRNRPIRRKIESTDIALHQLRAAPRWLIGLIVGPGGLGSQGRRSSRLLRSIFRRKRRAVLLTFLPAVASKYHAPARRAISRGRYLVFAPVANGRAV